MIFDYELLKVTISCLNNQMVYVYVHVCVPSYQLNKQCLLTILISYLLHVDAVVGKVMDAIKEDSSYFVIYTEVPSEVQEFYVQQLVHMNIHVHVLAVHVYTCTLYYTAYMVVN